MNVVNVGSYTITLDYNTKFRSNAAGNVGLTTYDAVIVGSTGTYWYQLAYWSNNGDIAEWYVYNGERPESGDLVAISQGDTRIEKASLPYDQKIAGIVSTQPAITIGQKTDDSIILALTGRVPLKVFTKNSQIQSGDSLTSSSLAGFGMKATQAGQVVGKALESTEDWNEQNCPAVTSLEAIVWPEDDGTNPAKPCYRIPDPSNPSEQIYVGKIMAFVNLSWSDPDIYLTDTGSLEITNPDGIYNGLLVNQTSDPNLLFSPENFQSIYNNSVFTLKNSAGETIQRIGAFREIISGKIKTGILQTADLITQNLIATQANISNLRTNLLTSNQIASPLIEVDDLTVKNSFISPLVETDVIRAKSLFGQILETETASISSLIADNLESETGTIASLFSEEIRAGRILADEIIGATIGANYITNISNVTNVYESASSFDLDDLDGLLAEIEKDILTIGPYVDIATLSAQLASVETDFKVLGHTTLADTSVAGIFTQDATFVISDGRQIDVLGDDLYLQRYRLGGVNIADGKILIDHSGNLTVNADLSIKGGRLVVKDLKDQEVASIDASGSALVKEIKIVKEDQAVLGLDEIEASSSAGRGTISAGYTALTIKTPYAQEDSLIYLTPTSPIDKNNLYLARIKDQESFTVEIVKEENYDIYFNWLIIN